MDHQSTWCKSIQRSCAIKGTTYEVQTMRKSCRRQNDGRKPRTVHAKEVGIPNGARVVGSGSRETLVIGHQGDRSSQIVHIYRNSTLWENYGMMANKVISPLVPGCINFIGLTPIEEQFTTVLTVVCNP